MENNNYLSDYIKSLHDQIQSLKSEVVFLKTEISRKNETINILVDSASRKELKISRQIFTIILQIMKTKFQKKLLI